MVIKRLQIYPVDLVDFWWIVVDIWWTSGGLLVNMVDFWWILNYGGFWWIWWTCGGLWWIFGGFLVDFWICDGL